VVNVNVSDSQIGDSFGFHVEFFESREQVGDTGGRSRLDDCDFVALKNVARDEVLVPSCLQVDKEELSTDFSCVHCLTGFLQALKPKVVS